MGLITGLTDWLDKTEYLNLLRSMRYCRKMCQLKTRSVSRYPLVIEHSWHSELERSTILEGKSGNPSVSTGPFSTAMLVITRGYLRFTMTKAMGFFEASQLWGRVAG